MTAADAPPAPPPLGRLLVLTDRRQCRRQLTEVLRAAVEGGARTVVLREKDLPDAERAALAGKAEALLAPVGGRVVLAGTGVRADAVHLSSSDPLPSPRPLLLGRSCHDAAAVARAAAEGCDWVTASPVRLTATKPGYGPPLGLEGLAALTATPVPVYALGGLTAADAPGCLDAGAAGIAVLGAVMRADDPAAAVAQLLAALSSSPDAHAHPWQELP